MEGGAAVVKVLADGFDAVMAALAIRAIRHGMFLHKNGVHLQVTGSADGGVEFGDIVAVTVGAKERLPIAAALM